MGAPMALQASSLAQLPVLYLGMQMSAITSRMTSLELFAIGPLLDPTSEGWRFGLRARNLQFEHSDSRFRKALLEVRDTRGLRAGDISAPQS